jgi:hypothetical protein
MREIIKIWAEINELDQCNRLENQALNPHSSAHLIFDKGTKNI